MTERREVPNKVSQYLIHLFDAPDTQEIHDFLIHSKIYFDDEYSPKAYGDTYFLVISAPETFKKYQNVLDDFKTLISEKTEQFTQIYISNVKIIPDLKKFQVLENRVVPINTPWEDINQDQNILLEQLRTASNTLEYQNIGNTCRSILQKLSNIVFDENKHKAADKNIVLDAGKFKNRLHTYIKCELTGEKKKELRDLAVSMVEATENSIDTLNKVTHDLNASLISSEFCVISTVTVIGIIKLIAKSDSGQ